MREGKSRNGGTITTSSGRTAGMANCNYVVFSNVRSEGAGHYSLGGVIRHTHAQNLFLALGMALTQFRTGTAGTFLVPNLEQDEEIINHFSIWLYGPSLIPPGLQKQNTNAICLEVTHPVFMFSSSSIWQGLS